MACTSCTKTRITNNNPYANTVVRSTAQNTFANTTSGAIKVQKITFGSKK